SVAIASVGVGQLPRRQLREAGGPVGARPRPDQPSERNQQRKLKEQTEKRWHSTELPDHAVTKQKSENAGAQESRGEAADQAGTAEQTAQRPGGIRRLRVAGRSFRLLYRERRFNQSDRGRAVGNVRVAQ